MGIVRLYNKPPKRFAVPGPTVADMRGDTFGLLKVIGYAGFDMDRIAAIWWVQCTGCSRYKKCARTSLMFGRTKSCGSHGCRSEAIKRFGLSQIDLKNNEKGERRRRYLERQRIAREKRQALLTEQKARHDKAMAAQLAEANRPRRAIDTIPRWSAPNFPRDKNGHVTEVGYSPYRITCQGDSYSPAIDPDSSLCNSTKKPQFGGWNDDADYQLD